VKRATGADDPRRRLLIKALAAGLFSSGSVVGADHAAAQVSGGRPAKLPPDRSVFSASGTTTVNDKPVAQGTLIRPGDTVRTSKNSEIVFVVSDCSMLLRADSQLVLEGQTTGRLVGFRLLVGKLLSVYPPGTVRIETATAKVEIRGTGVYVESDPELTYFCTCFGVTDVAAKDDPDSSTSVQASHHDRPLYIDAGAKNRGNSIRPAGFINHTDEELKLIEALVGRTLPATFVFGDPRYQAPKGGIYRP
jgi:FecR-like protein